MGEATAGTLRWVSTVTSKIPSAVSAVTAPRAVAPVLVLLAGGPGHAEAELFHQRSQSSPLGATGI